MLGKSLGKAPIEAGSLGLKLKLKAYLPFQRQDLSDFVLACYSLQVTTDCMKVYSIGAHQKGIKIQFSAVLRTVIIARQ